MVRMPRIAGIDARRALEHNGWYIARSSRGSHVQLRHPDKPGRVTIPMHTGEILAPKTLATIVTQARLTMDEFRSLL